MARGGAAARAMTLLLPLLVTLAACSRQSTETQPASSTGRRPNVVFVLVDALRADRLGVNGYPRPTTPNLDALAADGVNFTAFFSHSTWTKPSIATLFTSLYPTQHGVGTVAEERSDGFVTDILADDFVTLAERFQEAGYATVGAVNQAYLQDRYGFAQGFDFYRRRRGTTARGINEVFGRWLARRSPGDDRPVFAYLHYLDVHWPYTRQLEGQMDAFGRTEMSSPPPQSGSAVAGWLAGGLDPDDLAALEARYDREVAYTDKAIGGLVDLLDRNDLLDDTILVITSDHGEGFLEHGLLQHSYDPFDELVRIPLVIHWPSWTGGTGVTVDELCGLIDLMPTLLDLAGLEPETQSQGRSLAPLMTGGDAVYEEVFAEHQGRRMARGRGHKLMERANGALEFYDLADDPSEERPQTGLCQGPCSDLLERLEEFSSDLERSRATSDGAMEEVTAEDVEDLKALGYL